MPGALYVVATPIGNLADLSDRARTVLAEVEIVLCEDTRVTTKLLRSHGIEAKLRPFHAHSSDRTTGRIVRELEEGSRLALVSDAGTPLLSDPGGALVGAVIEAGVEVIPVPGPSALLAALMGSGLPAQPFVFLGFLARTASAQRTGVRPFASLPVTVVLYEAPGRVATTLGNLADVFGRDRAACVARELTKRFETFERGPLGELSERFGTEAPKGEVVIVVGPSLVEQDAEDRDARLHAEARRLVASGARPSEAAKLLAGAFGVPKKEAYRLLLDVERET